MKTNLTIHEYQKLSIIMDDIVNRNLLTDHREYDADDLMSAYHLHPEQSETLYHMIQTESFRQFKLTEQQKTDIVKLIADEHLRMTACTTIENAFANIDALSDTPDMNDADRQSILNTITTMSAELTNESCIADVFNAIES